MKIAIGAKWHDKVNGNTYHNCKVIDGLTGEIAYIGFQYGYGKSYLDDARKAFPNETIIDGGEFYLTKANCQNGRF